MESDNQTLPKETTNITENERNNFCLPFFVPTIGTKELCSGLKKQK